MDGHRSPTTAGGNLLFLGWRAEGPDDSMAPPAEIAKANALEIRSMAWEDGASHRWPMFLAKNQNVPGRVRVEVDAHLPGPQPHVAQLLKVLPRRPFDLEGDSDVGVAKGAQWWTPGSTSTITVTNRSTDAAFIEGGTLVATAFATD